MRRTMRAWVLSAVLVPTVFALAIVAVFIPRSAGPAGRPAQARPVVPQPAPSEPAPPVASNLTISLTPQAGGQPVALMVRITIAPPVQQDTAGHRTKRVWRP